MIAFGDRKYSIESFSLELELFKDPADIYLALRNAKPSFLFESKENTKSGRYSLIGIDPKATIEPGRETRAGGEGILAEIAASALEADPLNSLRRFFSKIECNDRQNALAAGFLSYDYARLIEKLPDRHKSIGEPSAFLMLLPDLISVDHFERKIMIHTFGEGAEERAGELAAKVQAAEEIKTTFKGAKQVQSRANTTKEQYINSVEAAKEYIRAGDAVQVVLSKRFEAGFKKDPFLAYLALRKINPSPYLYYLETGDLKIAGSSPETLVKVQGDEAYTRPIAGTAKRGATEKEDLELERQLLSDEKELAEHAMLVDLARNDLGKVCEYGSVSVSELMKVQRFSHVQHITSTVKGKPKTDCFETLKACFPAGTVSGAPKIRAMQIIDELEQEKRGIYAGCVGYFTHSGEMDTAIAIRTIVFREGKAFIQAGAGIVADSVPEKENQEAENKARAMLLALEMAEGAEK